MRGAAHRWVIPRLRLDCIVATRRAINFGAPRTISVVTNRSSFLRVDARLAAGALGIGLALALGGAFGAEVRAAPVDVSIVDYAFEPGDITVHVGDPITWTNDGGRAHTVTSDNGELDSGSIGPGEAYGHVFEQAGTVEYHCTIHPDRMQGTIKVLAATPAPSTDATPEPTPPTGTLPPNFSPFPSIGSAETAPTGSQVSSPAASTPPVDGVPAAGQAPLLFAIVLALGVLGAAAWYLRRRRLHAPSGNVKRRR